MIAGPRWHGKTVESMGAAASLLGHSYYPFYYIDATKGFSQNAVQRRFNRVSPYPYLLSPEVWRMNRHLLLEGERFKPDILILLHANLVFPFTIKRLKDLTHTRIVNWVLDEPITHKNIMKSMALYDHFFCWDRHYLAVIQRISGVKGTYLPCACNPDLHKVECKKDRKDMMTDLSFVGAYYSDREALLRYIRSECPDLRLKIWGPGWKERLEHDPLFSGCIMGPAPVEQFPEIAGASKINLNIHHNQTLDGGANMRTFELACMGVFQLVDYVKGLEGLFQPGEEVAVYRDKEDLIQKINFYSEKSDKREDMAQKARIRSMKSHTYQCRLETILEVVGH